MILEKEKENDQSVILSRDNFVPLELNFLSRKK